MMIIYHAEAFLRDRMEEEDDDRMEEEDDDDQVLEE
jgi:hypothetical protein